MHKNESLLFGNRWMDDQSRIGNHAMKDFYLRWYANEKVLYVIIGSSKSEKTVWRLECHIT